MSRADSDAPADTRLMGIVHEALRRDLRRSRTALTAAPSPGRGQRAAIAPHLAWMMQFLDAHHSAEDEGLYPMVRQRNPDAGALIDQMSADHQAIAPGIAQLRACADDYRRDDSEGQRERLLAALDDLEESLLPHLRREEDEMMPVVSATITDGQWRRWDHEQNIKPKSFAQLGREGHWIIDGLGPEERHLVLGLVPPLPRFLLLHGFAGAYRRQRAACWGETVRPTRRVQKQGRVEVLAETDRDALWDVVRDVTRVGEWSHECVGAEWLGDATTAVPGARFRGRNRSGILRWGRVCEIVEATPWELAWRTVPTVLYPDSSEWRIRLHEEGSGTRIEQSFRVLKAPKLLDVVYATIIPHHRDRTEALIEDLRRLAALATTTTQRAPSPSGNTSNQPAPTG